MALREFVDRSGRAWTVWEMNPENMHQRTRALGAFAEGWLCFESESGEKRRLSPIPPGWDEVPTDQLEALCTSASPARVTPERGTGALAPNPDIRVDSEQ